MFLAVSAVLALSVITFQASNVGCSPDGEDQKSLLYDLFYGNSNYDSMSAPDNVSLQFGLSFLCARFSSGPRGELKTRALEQYMWKDSRLTWKPKDYNNVDTIRVRSWMIWKPDILLYNSHETSEQRTEVNAVVWSDGSVIWIPPVLYKTLCSSTNDNWECILKLGSWTYDKYALDLQLYNNDVDVTSMYIPACPYKIVHPKVELNVQYYSCCAEPYPDITYTFGIERNEEL